MKSVEHLPLLVLAFFLTSLTTDCDGKELTSSGPWRITTAGSELNLQAQPAITVEVSDGTSAQRWRVKRSGAGVALIAASGACLAATETGPSLRDCAKDDATQRWHRRGQLRNAATDECLRPRQLAAGNAVTLGDCATAPTWELMPAPTNGPTPAA